MRRTLAALFVVLLPVFLLSRLSPSLLPSTTLAVLLSPHSSTVERPSSSQPMRLHSTSIPIARTKTSIT